MLDSHLATLGLNPLTLDIIERSPDFFGIADPEGKALFVNLAGREIFGLGATEDISHLCMLSFIAPNSHNLFEKEVVIPSLKENVIHRVVDVKNFTTGEIFKLDFSFFIQKDQSGEPLCYMAFGKDLRSNKREQQLLESIQSTVHVGGWDLDLVRNKLTWTEGVYDIHEVPYGVEPDVGSAINFYAPHERERIRKCVEDCAQKGIQFDEEFEFISAKGKQRWVRSIGRPVYNTKSEITHLEGTFQDITDQKKAELESQSKAKQIESLIRNAPGMVYQFKMSDTGEMSFPFVSLKAFELYEVNQSEFEKNPRLMIEMVHPEDQKILLDSIAESARDLSAFHWEGRIITKSGAIKFIMANSSPRREGEAVIWDGIMVDITTQKALSDKLIQNAKMASIGELSAGVGHEINNPLAIAIGNLDLCKNSLDKNSPLYSQKIDKLNKVYASLDRIRKIVDGLRTYARKDQDNHRDVDLIFAVDQTLNLLSEVYTHQGINIKSIPSEKSILVNGNIGKLQQILMILIANAKDATQDKEQRNITIRTEVDKAKSIVKLSVQDNGKGIPENVQKHLFKPFYTTKPVGEGTGIGLNMAQNLAYNMQGQISYETKLGEGSIFTLELPLSKNFATDNSIPKKLEPKEIEKVNSIIHKALIIDDEADIREIMQEYLQELGFSCETAENGERGLEKLSTSSFDIIFTDLTMPKMDGYDFIQAVEAKFEHFPPIVILSGNISNLDSKNPKLEKLKSEFKYLQKPFKEEDLIATIKSCLD